MATTERKSLKVTKAELTRILTNTFSDLYWSNPKRNPTIQDVQGFLYHYVILRMFDKDRFFCEEEETDGTFRKGLFIKGYVRDVWDYLEEAYKLTHDPKFITREVVQKHIATYKEKKKKIRAIKNRK